MKKGWTKLDRANFIKARYENFLAKKKFLEDNPAMRGAIYMSDLDSNYGDSKLLKDVVLCDFCNEDIEEPTILMLEGQKVYHYKCVKYQYGLDPALEPIPLEAYENVIPFRKREGR